MEHDVNVGAAVADVHDPFAGHTELHAQLVDSRHFAIASRHANNGRYFTRVGIELEAGRDDALGWDDAFEGRVHDLLRGRRHDIEVELIPVDATRETFDEHVDVSLAANAAPDIDEIIAPYAPELGVVAEQIRQLGTRLHEVESREAGDLFGEVDQAERLAQDVAGVIEAQRLVKIAYEQVMPRHSFSSETKTPPHRWTRGRTSSVFDQRLPIISPPRLADARS